MIIKKNDNGTYQCEVNGRYYDLNNKEYYLAEKQSLEALQPPTIDEIMELVKAQHPYYLKDISLENINNQLAEIEAFENGNNL